MGKWDKREGSIYHVDDHTGHRYFIISDREFTNCGHASEYRYTQGCHCDACRDAHTNANRGRKERARSGRRQTAGRPRRVPETNLRNINRDIRGDA